MQFRFGRGVPIAIAVIASLSPGVRSGAATFNILNGDVAGLVAAIQSTDTNNQDDTINLAPNGSYILTGPDHGYDGLPAIEIDNNHNVTINGNGATIMRSSASGTLDFRILTVGVAFGHTVTISNLTMSNGFLSVATGLAGGALAVSGSTTLSLLQCTITNNHAIRGGAIANAGVLTITNCTVIGNSALQGNGGAIQNDGSNNAHGATAEVFLNNCTFSGNSASGNGGAVASSDDNGGGVAGALISVSSCTFYNNSASSGGGIYNDTFNGIASVTLRSSIFVNSMLANRANPGNNHTITSDGYNLSNDNGSGFLNQATDQINTDPAFDPLELQDNGGPTQTIALTYGSPAIDKGNSFGLTTDQRGSSRPYDNPSVPNASGGDGSDIGAYEVAQGQDPVQGGTGFVVTTTSDHDDGVCGGADCTLREAVARANTVPGDNSIIFAHSLTGSITLTQGEMAVTDSLSITGIPIGTISGNSSSRIFSFTGGSSYLNGLTIRDGRKQVIIGNPTNGGGIYNSATLHLYGCSLINNHVLGTDTLSPSSASGGAGQGGGIYNSGTLFLDASAFIQTNEASGGNGGPGNFGHGGVASGSGGAGRGGAVFNDTSGSLFITNCTFNGNVALGGNGGSGGPFGGNGGGGDGGAIYNLGTMTVTGATISGNTGSSGTPGTGTTNGGLGMGRGGIAAVGGSATIANTIAAGNMGSNGGGGDVDGLFTSNGYNLIGNGDFSNGFNATGDQVGTTAAPIDPKLGAPQDNGGPTKTMALLSNSPAIDQGKRFNLSYDQRGHERPFDAPNIANASGGDGSDIGAFELGGTLVPISAVSQKIHGGAGPFNIALPLSGPVGVECRSGGATGDYQIVVTFAAPVSINGNPQAQIASGTGQIGSGGTSNGGVVTVNGATVTVPLTNVTNAQRVTLSLLSASDGSNTNDVSVPIGFLLGDVTGNGSTNASDVSLTKAKSGQSVDATNFRSDVTINGSINASDVSLVKSKSGTALP